MTILSQMNLRGNQTQKLVKTQIDSNFTTLANGVDAALTGQASGVAGYATKANLLADLSLPDKAVAYVTSDTTPANNGTYRKSGASGAGTWVQSSFDRVAVVEQAVAAKARNVVGKNLFDFYSASITYGYYINQLSGTLDINATYNASGYIAVTAGQYYTFSNLNRVAWYNTSYVFVSGELNSGSNITVLAPAGAAYLRFSTFAVGTVWKSTLQVEQGTSATAFEAYINLEDAVDHIAALLADVNNLETSAAASDEFLSTLSYTVVTQITHNGETPVVAETSHQNTLAKVLPFTGWGSKYNNIGAWTVNLARIPNITYTDTGAWKAIHIEIRDIGPTGTLLAVGTSYIDPSSAEQTGLSIALRDPATLALTSLSNADFGTTYFVGYTATDINGAACSVAECIGVITSGIYQGNSYYKTTVWADNGPDYCISIELLNATGLSSSEAAVIGISSLPGGLPPADGSVSYDTLDSFLSLQMLESIDIVLAPAVYAVVGHEMNVYFENLISLDANEFNWDVTCTLGRQQSERWTYVSEASGTTTLDISVFAKGAQTALKVATQASLIVASAAAGTGLTRRLLVIGDSTTAANTTTIELNNLFSADAMNITCIGTRGTGIDLHEGVSGWTAQQHFTDVTSAFVFSGVFNFPQFISTNGFAGCDVTIINLGINDIFSAATDAGALAVAASMAGIYESMITSMHTYNAAMKIGIALTSPPSYSQDGWGVSYLCGQTRWRFRRNLMILWRHLIDQFGGRTGSGIYVVPINSNLDTVNNMPRYSPAPANSRTSVTVARQSNGVHPATEGYYQIADTIFAFLKGLES